MEPIVDQYAVLFDIIWNAILFLLYGVGIDWPQVGRYDCKVDAMTHWEIPAHWKPASIISPT